MKDERVGSILIDGKMVDLDGLKIDKLEEMSKEFGEKEENLKRKINTVFKQ